MLFILAERRRDFQSLVVYKMRYMNALNRIKPNSISFNQCSINRRYSRTPQAEYGMHSLLAIPWNRVEKECKATSKNRQQLYEVFLWITHYWDDVVQAFYFTTYLPTSKELFSICRRNWVSLFLSYEYQYLKLNGLWRLLRKSFLLYNIDRLCMEAGRVESLKERMLMRTKWGLMILPVPYICTDLQSCS